MNFKEKLKDAICNNNVDFLEKHKHQYLIDERFEDEDNDTLLLYSISDAATNVYEYFLRNNADVFLVNNEGENILHSIVYSGNIERLKIVLDKYKVDINSCTKDGATPLLLSLSLENSEIANVLINYGADVNIPDIEGITPLHLSVQLDNLSLVVTLVEHGADILAKTLAGNYPLALAVNAGFEDIIKYLYHKIYG
jgi:ankyrin repeat protein